MTARGVEYLEDWIGKSIKAETTPADAGWLAAHLLAEAAVAGFTLADLELDQETAETYIRKAVARHEARGIPRD